MINERKIVTILGGTFMISMVGLLTWIYFSGRNERSSEDNSLQTEFDYAAIAASVQKKFLSAMNDSEQHTKNTMVDAAAAKKEQSGINLEPGLFL